VEYKEIQRLMKIQMTKRQIINTIYIAVIIIVLFSNIWYRELSLLLYLRPDYTFKNKTEIHFINVGQGDAVAIKFDNGQVMLIDSGTEEYCDKLCRYLDKIVLDDRNTIDYLVLTHKDTDHSGNIPHLLKNYKVGVLYRPMIYSTSEDSNSTNTSDWYDYIVDIARSRNIPMIFNEAGIKLIIGESLLTWLSPIGIEHNADIDSNDFSPIIRLDYRTKSALFTGDVGFDTEEEVIDSYEETMLDVDILKVAHHGSAYSTSDIFLETTSPDVAVISVGYNTYGHPSNTLMQRILEYDKLCNAKLFNNTYTTKSKGNIIVTMDDELDIKCIDNIDNYSFVDYWIYSAIFILLLVVLMLKPYYSVWVKKLKFYRQNKKFEKNNSDTN